MSTRLVHQWIANAMGRVPLSQSACQTDADLLEEFVQHRDAATFAQLFQRLAPMVMGVCQRVIRHQQSAEDAFQATFLVLAQKACCIEPREKLGCWLYGVAYRTALDIRRRMIRQRLRETPLQSMHEQGTEQDSFLSELRAVLDRELFRLPEIYRTPIVLCDLQERTQRDAARQLRLPHGTLSNRLTKGRQLLATRLARLRISLSVAAMSATLSALTATTIPLTLASTTLEHVNQVIKAGSLAAIASPQLQHLTQGVLTSMINRKLTSLAAVIMALCGLSGGLYLTAQASQPGASTLLASTPLVQDVPPKPLEKPDPFKNAMGWKWALKPTGVFASSSSNGINVIYDYERKDVIDVVIAWAVGPNRNKYRPVAFDDENHRYDFESGTGGSSSGKDGAVSLLRFRMKPAVMKGKSVAKLGVEVLTEEGRIVVAEYAAQRARKLGVEILSRPEVGQPLKFTLTDIDGKKIDSDELRGKVVLIDFWATWCSPCMAKMPELKELYEQRHKEGLEIVGISLDHTLDKAKKTIADKVLPWRQVFMPEDDAVRELWTEVVGIESIPRLFLIDRKGILRGDVGPYQLKAETLKLLVEKE